MEDFTRSIVGHKTGGRVNKRWVWLVVGFGCLLVSCGKGKVTCPQGQEFRQERVGAHGALTACGCVSRNTDGSYRREGRWEFFYTDGQKGGEGAYKNTLVDAETGNIELLKEEEGDDRIYRGRSRWKIDSRWDIWHENAKKDLERRDGPWVLWHWDGPMEQKITYRNGKEEGFAIFWHENGKKAMEGPFRNGRREGPWTAWHENGQKSVEGRCQNDYAEGLWVYWNSKGQRVAETTFRNGKEEGLATEWYPNGKKQKETPFRNGKEEGVEVQWDEAGMKFSEAPFRNGKQEGVEVSWNDDGSRMEKSYRNGNEDGLTVIWHANGQKLVERMYKNGEDVPGTFKKWDEKGNRIK